MESSHEYVTSSMVLTHSFFARIRDWTERQFIAVCSTATISLFPDPVSDKDVVASVALLLLQSKS